VQLYDTGVASKHAELQRTTEGGYRLSDKGSAAGTLVNDKPITGSVVLQPGSLIKVGEAVLRYSEETSRWTGLNADFRENLTGKHVRPSEPLLRLGDKENDWEGELKIPPKHIGHV